MDWIHLAQKRYHWRALVNTIKHSVSKNVANLLTEDSLVTGDLPCSMALASQR